MIARRFWTTEEERLLREHYGTMPNSELRARHFPERTESAIETKAYKFGLSKSDTRWSREEDSLLIENSGKLTVREMKAKGLGHRTIGAIRHRLRQLGLNAVSSRRGGAGKRRWTLEEENLLTEHCPGMTVREYQAEYAPERTIEALRQRAKVLGVSFMYEPGRGNTLEVAPITPRERELRIQYSKEQAAKRKREAKREAVAQSRCAKCIWQNGVMSYKVICSFSTCMKKGIA